MSYEQKYKEALERCRKLYNEAKAHEYNQDLEDYEIIFPELKESGDERIRKALIEYFNEQCDMSDWNGVYGYQVVAWLEKQGESYAKKDVDDAYLKGVCDAKSELEKYAPIDIDKMVDDYANNEEFGKPLNCMIRAYRQGLKDAIGKVVSESAWSEEDDVRLQACLDTLQAKSLMGVVDTNMTKWLKSLKQRIGG